MILMRVLVSSHVLLMLVVVQAWPNCVIHSFVSWFLSAGGGEGCVCEDGVGCVVGCSARGIYLLFVS